MADKLEQAQLAVLLLPHATPEGRTRGGGEEDEQHPPVQITKSAMFGSGGERRYMQAAFPSAEHELSGEGLARCLEYFRPVSSPSP